MREFYFLLLVAIFGGQAQAQVCAITNANASQDLCTICSAGTNPALVNEKFSGRLEIHTDYTISASCLANIVFGPTFDIYFVLNKGNDNWRLIFGRDPFLGVGNVTTIGANKSKRGIVEIYGTVWDNKNGANAVKFPALEEVMNNNATYKALPVNIVDWNVEIEGTAVDLRWTTNEEEEHDYFVIEHSSDGLVFEPLIAVMNPESSYEGLLRDYHYVHRHPSPGTNYYRLAQHDTDGSVTTFAVRSVNLIKSASAGIHPNPARAGQTIGLQSTDDLHEANLYRLDGTLVASFQEVDNILSALTLPTNLVSGTYVLRAGRHTHQVVIQ